MVKIAIKKFKIRFDLQLTIFQSTESKSKVLYINANRKIEKWSRIAYFLLALATPIMWIGPKFISSLFVYFTTDLGNDALELPLLEWCV